METFATETNCKDPENRNVIVAALTPLIFPVYNPPGRLGI